MINNLKRVFGKGFIVLIMLDILGITVDRIELTEEDRQLFEGWNAAKKEKDWDKADTYRNALSQKGLL